MVEINRVWLNVDTDTNKITLFGRPRVSIRVDEYIWSLIEEHIVKPHKLMRSEKHYIQDAVYLRIKEGGRIVMGNGFHFSLVQQKSGF